MKRLGLIITSALALAACSGENAQQTGDSVIVEATTTATLVDVAQGDGELSQLSQALGIAGLEETLSGEGPLTIFAPTNAAFDAVDAATLEQLKTSDTERLGAILRNHVVEGTLDYATLSAAIEEAGEGGHAITMLGGGTITARLQEGAIVLSDASGGSASVSAVDVEAENGLIHIIDAVLMPQ